MSRDECVQQLSRSHRLWWTSRVVSKPRDRDGYLPDCSTSSRAVATKLLCVARSSGKIRWISKLQRYTNEEKKKGPISWQGPVLAGGRLIAVNSRGAMWSVSPADGTATALVDLESDVSLAPVVANNMLYVLDDKGRISAFR